MTDKGSQEKIALPSKDEYSRLLAEDMFRRISDDQLLNDVVEGNEDLPEYIELEDVITIRCYLPDERLGVLDKFVKRFCDSVNEAKQVSDFNGWLNFFGDACFSPYKEHLAILMMTYTAKSFIDWLTLFYAICTSENNFFAIKRFALIKMRQSAKSAKEQSSWRKLAKELGMPMNKEEV